MAELKDSFPIVAYETETLQSYMTYENIFKSQHQTQTFSQGN